MELKEKLTADLQEMQAYRTKLDTDEKVLQQNKASLDFNISYIKSLLEFIVSDDAVQPTLHDVIKPAQEEKKCKKKEGK